MDKDIVPCANGLNLQDCFSGNICTQYILSFVSHAAYMFLSDYISIFIWGFISVPQHPHNNI